MGNAIPLTANTYTEPPTPPLHTTTSTHTHTHTHLPYTPPLCRTFPARASSAPSTGWPRMAPPSFNWALLQTHPTCTRGEAAQPAVLRHTQGKLLCSVNTHNAHTKDAKLTLIRIYVYHIVGNVCRKKCLCATSPSIYKLYGEHCPLRGAGGRGE